MEGSDIKSKLVEKQPQAKNQRDEEENTDSASSSGEELDRELDKDTKEFEGNSSEATLSKIKNSKMQK